MNCIFCTRNSERFFLYSISTSLNQQYVPVIIAKFRDIRSSFIYGSFPSGFPLLKKNRHRRVLGLRFPEVSAWHLLLGWALASWPCPFLAPYLKLQVPVAASLRTLQRGFPGSHLAEEPHPWERHPRPPGAARLPWPLSRDTPPPTGARRRAEGVGERPEGSRGRALEGAELGPGPEQPGNSGGARILRWVSCCCDLSPSRALRELVVWERWGAGRKKLGLPRSARSAGHHNTRRVSGFTPTPSLYPPARSEAREQ